MPFPTRSQPVTAKEYSQPAPTRASKLCWFVLVGSVKRVANHLPFRVPVGAAWRTSFPFAPTAALVAFARPRRASAPAPPAPSARAASRSCRRMACLAGRKRNNRSRPNRHPPLPPTEETRPAAAIGMADITEPSPILPTRERPKKKAKPLPALVPLIRTRRTRSRVRFGRFGTGRGTGGLDAGGHRGCGHLSSPMGGSSPRSSRDWDWRSVSRRWSPRAARNWPAAWQSCSHRRSLLTVLLLPSWLGLDPCAARRPTTGRRTVSVEHGPAG